MRRVLFLNEEQLTTELSLSRTPVRDALGRLEQEGLLEIRPKCGILVRPLTLNDIDMIFEVRMMYEPYVLTHYGANLSVSALNEFYDIFKNGILTKKSIGTRIPSTTSIIASMR